MPVKKSKNGKLFIKIRGSYLPCSFYGWLSYIPFVTYLILVPILTINYSDNLVLACLITIPNWAIATIIMTYYASLNS